MVLLPAGIVKTPIASPYLPRVSDSAGLEWGLRINISNMVLGDADAAGLGATLGMTLFQILSKGHSHL